MILLELGRGHKARGDDLTRTLWQLCSSGPGGIESSFTGRKPRLKQKVSGPQSKTGDNMTTMTRREHMKGLLGLAASLSLPQQARTAEEAPIPPQGIGRRIRHLSYSDLGGRPDSVQVMFNRRHVYVGHMFSNGVTILDAADPRRLKPVGFFTGGDYTRTHHLQVAEDMLLLANGANIVAMQSYDNLRGYFENALADSITNRKKFRSGLSIHDISRPAEMKEIDFLEMPGLGINRLWWTGGRYAYIAAHF